MTTPTPISGPNFFQRIPLAFNAFFKVLFATPSAPAPVVEAPTPLKIATPDAALQLLGLFQRDARLIDFTQEDLASYSDADIGAAARVVHEGCCKVLREHFTITPMRPEPEGSRLTLPDGFDARAIRLTGNVVGTAPYKGTLSHRGWRATETRLPQLTPSHDVTVLAQAEVEL
ncbi:MAG: DUF2760 domain-containing protein [Rhodoferax sp.]|uniref:DUF2760 domain-containing protein n=1 Tax=Rhodoferax sp. TaxID=50421 RepID=UPI0030197A79